MFPRGSLAQVPRSGKSNRSAAAMPPSERQCHRRYDGDDGEQPEGFFESHDAAAGSISFGFGAMRFTMSLASSRAREDSSSLGK